MFSLSNVFDFWMYVLHIYRNKQGCKRMLFNRTRQCNIQIFDRNIFVKTKQIKATKTNR